MMYTFLMRSIYYSIKCNSIICAINSLSHSFATIRLFDKFEYILSIHIRSTGFMLIPLLQCV